MKKIFLILLLLSGPTAKLEAQYQFQNVQYLPHIVAGTLSSSEWDTVIELKCLSSDPCPMTIEFFDSVGAPLVLDTDKGVSNRFDIVVSPGVPGPGSFPIQIRRNQQFVSGWARITSPSTFSGFGKFRQFELGGINPVGVASVFFSASDIVLTFDLKPSNGVALVNPSTADAMVTATALVGGREVVETFQLPKGHHKAMFFREPPFSFGDLTGNVVISSAVPIAGVELGFEGPEFFTLPSLPTIRRLDAKRANIKIGVVYACAEIGLDHPCKKAEDVAQRVDKAFSLFEKTLRNEIALSGAMQNIAELPIDRDENGLPKVLMVKLQKPREWYSEKIRSYNGNDMMDEIRANLDFPPNWKFRIVYYDVWKEDKSKNTLEGIENFASSSGIEGDALLSAFYLQYLTASFFEVGNKEKTEKLPGFGVYSKEELAEYEFGAFSHEIGHMMGLFHAGADPLDGGARPFFGFMTTLGGLSTWGCYSHLNFTQQCVWSPVDVFSLARKPLLNIHKYGWVDVEQKFDFPELAIISKEWIGDKVRAVIKARDIESGINSVFLTSNLSPGTHYWKVLGHTENLEELAIEAKIPIGSTQISIGIMDYHGNITFVQLF